MSNPNFFEVAQGAWSMPALGCPSKILAIKCARTLKALARWNKFNIKSEGEQAKELEKKIDDLQTIEAARPLVDQELA